MAEKDEGRFPTTHWTLIARLKSDDAEESEKALDELCAQYHYPLYCYIRWRGLNHHDAQDALHDFLSKLLRLESLKTADIEKGKLRSFLATALQRFLMNRHRDNRRRATEVTLDEDVVERFERERFSDETTPEKALDRTWAATVLKCAFKDTEDAEIQAGRGARFEALAPFLSPENTGGHYAALAQKMGHTEAMVRQAVKRLREKFRTHLRKRVAETLSQPTPKAIDEELKALRSLLAP